MVSQATNTESQRVNLSEIRMDNEWDVIYWCLVLKCTKQELEEMVRQYGNSSTVVRDLITDYRTSHN
jgi:hypothetical protein